MAKGRVAGLVAVVLLSPSPACSPATPSPAPLAKAPVPAPKVERPSSSRAFEGEAPPEREEVEILVQPSDDDDTGAKCSVGTGGPPDCGLLPSASSCLG